MMDPDYNYDAAAAAPPPCAPLGIGSIFRCHGSSLQNQHLRDLDLLRCNNNNNNRPTSESLSSREKGQTLQQHYGKKNQGDNLSNMNTGETTNSSTNSNNMLFSCGRSRQTDHDDQPVIGTSSYKGLEAKQQQQGMCQWSSYQLQRLNCAASTSHNLQLLNCASSSRISHVVESYGSGGQQQPSRSTPMDQSSKDLNEFSTSLHEHTRSTGPALDLGPLMCIAGGGGGKAHNEDNLDNGELPRLTIKKSTIKTSTRNALLLPAKKDSYSEFDVLAGSSKRNSRWAGEDKTTLKSPSMQRRRWQPPQQLQQPEDDDLESSKTTLTQDTMSTVSLSELGLGLDCFGTPIQKLNVQKLDGKDMPRLTPLSRKKDRVQTVAVKRVSLEETKTVAVKRVSLEDAKTDAAAQARAARAPLRASQHKTSPTTTSRSSNAAAASSKRSSSKTRRASEGVREEVRKQSTIVKVRRTRSSETPNNNTASAAQIRRTRTEETPSTAVSPSQQPKPKRRSQQGQRPTTPKPTRGTTPIRGRTQTTKAKRRESLGDSGLGKQHKRRSTSVHKSPENKKLSSSVRSSETRKRIDPEPAPAASRLQILGGGCLTSLIGDVDPALAQEKLLAKARNYEDKYMHHYQLQAVAAVSLSSSHVSRGTMSPSMPQRRPSLSLRGSASLRASRTIPFDEPLSSSTQHVSKADKPKRRTRSTSRPRRSSSTTKSTASMGASTKSSGMDSSSRRRSTSRGMDSSSRRRSSDANARSQLKAKARKSKASVQGQATVTTSRIEAAQAVVQMVESQHRKGGLKRASSEALLRVNRKPLELSGLVRGKPVRLEKHVYFEI